MSERNWDSLAEHEKLPWLHDNLVMLSGKVLYLLARDKELQELEARLQAVEAKQAQPQ
jgi:hypothetical protein